MSEHKAFILYFQSIINTSMLSILKYNIESSCGGLEVERLTMFYKSMLYFGGLNPAWDQVIIMKIIPES